MKQKQGEKSDTTEVILGGIAASPGIIVGPCFVYQVPAWEPEPEPVSPAAVPAEIERFRSSVEAVRKQLHKSHQNTLKNFGKDLAEILEMQLLLLDDDVFLREVEEYIEEKRYKAAYATFTVFRRKKEHFLGMKNEYFRDRAFDIQSLKEMLVKTMIGKQHFQPISLDRPAIVIANNLTPADTLNLYQQDVLGFATNMGGKTSHTAIVARSLGVPAVVGVSGITDQVHNGDTVVLDGTRGRVILHPGAETVASHHRRKVRQEDLEARLLEESGMETRTRDGYAVTMLSNIELEAEIDHVNRVGSDGVGLFRTEGLFLNRDTFPTEDEQTEIYLRVAGAVQPRRLVVRTLDIGGDKMFPGLLSPKEDNPFLGWRAVRFWLDHEEGFLAQLKAIFRANRHGNVQMLLPMISGLGELQRVRVLMERAVDELREAGAEFNPLVPVGIMIEIPSAVMLARELAREVDFFSIGTNDLVQYTLAVDRGNEKVAGLYSHFHPAVLRMIRLTLDAAREAHIPVSMCGEMAGDPLAIPVLLAMGMDELSAAPNVIPEMKKVIRELNLPECRELLTAVESCTRTADIVTRTETFFRAHFPEMVTEDD